MNFDELMVFFEQTISTVGRNTKILEETECESYKYIPNYLDIINAKCDVYYKSLNKMLSNQFNILFDNISVNVKDKSILEWELGGIDVTTHILDNKTDRIRSKVIFAKKGSIFSYYTKNGNRWKICKYSTVNFTDAKSYIGDIARDGLDYDDIIILDEDCFIVIVLWVFNGISGLPDYASITENFNSLILTNNEITYDTNVYDKNYIYSGYIQSSNGAIISGTSGSGFNKHTISFKVVEGVKFQLQNTKQCVQTNLIAFYDRWGNFISVYRKDGIVQDTVPTNAYYCAFNVNETYVDYYDLRFYPQGYQFVINYRLIQDEPKVKLIAHRGYNGVAPEATIPAYELAGKNGFWGCKIDICETSDGYFVCSHDNIVDRMFDGTGKIRELTLAQIQAMTVDSGVNISQYPNQKIVRFEKALSICKKYGMHPYIEFKRLLSNESVSRVWNIVKYYGLEKVTLCQCSDGTTSYLSALRNISDLPTIVLWRKSFNPSSDLQFINSLDNAVLSLNSFSGSETSQFETYVAQSKELGLPVCTAVCTNLTYAKKWIEDYGLDLMVTPNITYSNLEGV